MPQNPQNNNDILGAIGTIIGAVFTFLTDNWVQITTLMFSGVALVYTIRNARASIILRKLEAKKELYDIELKKLALSQLETEIREAAEKSEKETENDGTTDNG